MPLSPGDRIGSYIVIARLGAGGMGEVYSALDTRLDRTVALKVLSPEFTADETFRERFTREARAIARLNHPNICSVYDAGAASVIGSAETMQFLAMEYLDGETLASRLARGPLDEQEAVPIARQLAQALHQAHRSGLIHRDLKPANVMLTKGGVKLLDFGLAKHAPGTGPADLTTIGVIVGTVQYMAPEQIAGRQVDARADIFALGTVMYEMLTGKKCFDGLPRPDVGLNPGAVEVPAPRIEPPAVDRIVRKCLATDPDDRWQSAADLATELEWVARPGDPQSATAPTRRSRVREIVAWSLVAVLGLVGAASFMRNARPVTTVPSISKRFSLTLPDLQAAVGVSRPFTLLPDGSGVVYFAGSATAWQIQIYSFVDGATRKLPQTENGRVLSVSADGKWIAFATGGDVRKTAVDGGASVRLCEAIGVTGITWIGNDSIVFGDAAGLKRVAAVGGEPETLTTIEPRELRHVSPHALPGGQAVLFTVLSQSGAAEDTAIVAISLTTRKRSRLLTGSSDARYSPSQHLVYVRHSDVMAVEFDPDRLQLRGTPFLAVPGVYVRGLRDGMFDFATDGTFVYVGLGDVQRTLVWVDRGGTETTLPVPNRAYAHPALLPDERSVIVELEDPLPHHLSQVDLTTGALTRLTDDSGNHRPVTSPDGRFVAFSSDRTKTRSLFRQATDGSGEPLRLTTATADQNVTSWSKDGRWLAFVQNGPKTQEDIWVVSLQGDGNPRPFLQTRYAEGSAVFSPDGQWIAYVSDESGRSEVMIRAFSGEGPHKQVSIAGGQTPAFSTDGTTLYYRMNNQIWAAAVSTNPLKIGAPAVAFELPGVRGITGLPNYVVNRAGDRVLAVKYLGGASRSHDVQVIVNWFSVLRRASAEH